MSQVTFSQDLGILEAGSDYKGFLRQSNRSLDYFASVRSISVTIKLFSSLLNGN